MDKLENKDVIDYGSWNIPTSWNDVSLKMFSELEKYYEVKERKPDLRDVLHILTNKTEDEVNELPMELVDLLLNKLEFMNTYPKQDEVSNKIIIDGETYIINVQNKLKVGEYIAVDQVLKADSHNYAAFLAILCRKEGEKYDSKFENEILEDRIKLFEEQPITKILPITAFFLNLWVMLEIPSQLSSEIKEAISHIRKNLETSVQNGEVSKRFMKSLEKKLKKLEKSINFI